MSKLSGIAIAAALLIAASACTPHTTAATEVGVKFNKVTRSTEIAEPGATYFFMPIINDWTTFDTSTQSLIMSAKAESGDRREKDDLRFKTRDGNDIETDVTVRWRIDPTRAAYIWQVVAPTTEGIKERLVRSLSRSYVRDVLNRLDSEEYYNPDLRFAAARDATSVLAVQLKPYGVIVENVLLGDFSFKPDYQRLINQRKEAEKQAEKLEAQILATLESNKANLQAKIAELTEQFTRSQGALEQTKRNADAYVVRRQQEAQATIAERNATAEGIRKERAALNGSAGDAYVSLQLIDALQKKEIRQIPKLPSGNVIIDGNKLLQQLGVIQYSQQQQQQAPASQ
ncbi:MAG TPA: SPFH domain-containing protein [Thermoanaerobaculia bacterium]|jgi:regulator of protease activity HflC (stomatin/prohibitin superfamily)|nr:SPFH domain-containing protein [Thermoanaerobaculia bacterium]